MGLNDGFIDKVQCPSCGEAVVMRLQIKMDGVYMNDYRVSDRVSDEVLKTIRESEADFVQAMLKDLGVPSEDMGDIPLESKDGTLAIVGSAYRIGQPCSCGQATERASRVAAVDAGVFRGLVENLPDHGPVVTDRGMVFPRWMLSHPDLHQHILAVLEQFFGE